MRLPIAPTGTRREEFGADRPSSAFVTVMTKRDEGM
jgi:hypothetical protein